MYINLRASKISTFTHPTYISQPFLSSCSNPSSFGKSTRSLEPNINSKGYNKFLKNSTSTVLTGYKRERNRLMCATAISASLLPSDRQFIVA